MFTRILWLSLGVLFLIMPSAGLASDPPAFPPAGTSAADFQQFMANELIPFYDSYYANFECLSCRRVIESLETPGALPEVANTQFERISSQDLVVRPNGEFLSSTQYYEDGETEASHEINSSFNGDYHFIASREPAPDEKWLVESLDKPDEFHGERPLVSQFLSPDPSLQWCSFLKSEPLQVTHYEPSSRAVFIDVTGEFRPERSDRVYRRCRIWLKPETGLPIRVVTESTMDDGIDVTRDSEIRWETLGQHQVIGEVLAKVTHNEGIAWVRTRLQQWDMPADEDPRMRLSFYGLPEPAFVPQRSPYRWSWFGLAALAGGIFFYFRSRG